MADVPPAEPVFDADVPQGHRSGYVAVVGRPNVGKSTLMNALLGEKLAIVSPRPQTTRLNQLGILTLPAAQLIFVDTPGLHEARNALGEFMVEAARLSIPDADVVLILVDVSAPPGPVEAQIGEAVARRGPDQHNLLLLNKRDLLTGDEEKTSAQVSAYQEMFAEVPHMLISAQNDDLSELLARLIDLLPEGPRYFPEDQLTETELRDNAAEIIREKIMLTLEDELPYAAAVSIEEFKERSSDLVYIRATVFVEKDSQKAIVIGQGGQTLKHISQMARLDLEQVLDAKVYLELWVKVLKNWRKDERALRRLGYSRK